RRLCGVWTPQTAPTSRTSHGRSFSLRFFRTRIRIRTRLRANGGREIGAGPMPTVDEIGERGIGRDRQERGPVTHAEPPELRVRVTDGIAPDTQLRHESGRPRR